MARFRACVIGLAVLGAGPAGGRAADRVPLGEAARPGQTTRVVVAMKAEGTLRPEAPPGATASKPQPLKVETRLEFVEKVEAADPAGRATRAVRRMDRASAAIGHFRGEPGALESTLRPDLGLLIAARQERGVVVFSPGGPLTRPELDLVQAPGDPLTLAALLPTKPVAEGDRWTVSDEAARALSDYDALASNRLEAKLEALDAATARVKIGGEVRGAVRGGEGTIRFDGTLRFDRKASRVEALELSRSEVRKAGPVEPGLDVKSTLAVDRKAVEAPPDLGEAVLSALPRDDDPQRLLLQFRSPDGKYTLLHDRDWHLFYDDTRRAVLKRLDQGEVVAQLNLAAGPKAGRGRHQALDQFRDDIRRALGQRFQRIAGEGEVAGSPAGGYRYKVAVEAREGDVDLVLLYYLIAGPEGDQLLATFTFTKAYLKRFADQDLPMIGSLEWAGKG